MSIPMALIDYIPVIFFAAAAVLLQRDLYHSMSKGAFALFSAGTIMVVTAGIFKASWKLLYALGICDFAALNRSFFPMQTTGFVLAAAGLVAFLTVRQTKDAAAYAVAAPVLYESNMPFVFLMLIGTLGIWACLAVIAKKMKKGAGAVLFAVSFVFVMMMGYLSSRDFAEAAMNWVAQGTNIVAQGLFFFGVLLLHKAGLAEWKPERKS